MTHSPFRPRRAVRRSPQLPASASASHAVARRVRAVRRRQARARARCSVASVPSARRSSRASRSARGACRSSAKIALDGLAAVHVGQAQGQRDAAAGHDRAYIVVRDRADRQDEPAPVHAHADAPVGDRRAGAQAPSMVGARFALTSAAAKRLRSALKLKRTPSTAALGKFTVGVADLTMTVPPTPQPAPAPSATPAPTATPTPTPTPEPVTPCAQRFAATPAGSVDWFGCDLPGQRRPQELDGLRAARSLPGPCCRAARLGHRERRRGADRRAPRTTASRSPRARSAGRLGDDHRRRGRSPT